MSGGLPVTLLSGFLGSGKTTLLSHILTHSHRQRIAVVVNDVAALNIDAALVRQRVVAAGGQLLQLQNGCICCTLRPDLVRSLRQLARSHAYDYCIVESTGVAEPMQVAEAFELMMLADDSAEPGDAAAPAACCRLDTCVTVVDAAQLADLLEDPRSITALDRQAPAEDQRPITQLLLDQIEFANVILLNKCDLVAPAAELDRLEQLLLALNPRATVHRTVRGAVALELVVGTGTFQLEAARATQGWMASVHQPAESESDIYGFNSVIYRRHRPFQPERLHTLLQQSFILQQAEDDVVPAARFPRRPGPLASSLRSKGFVWLATRHDVMGCWSQAGPILTLRGQGPWLCELAEAAARSLNVEAAYAEARARPDGDRRQELVFIGAPIDAGCISEALDGCLVTDEEWQRADSLGSPFDAWPPADAYQWEDVEAAEVAF